MININKLKQLFILIAVFAITFSYLDCAEKAAVETKISTEITHIIQDEIDIREIDKQIEEAPTIWDALKIVFSYLDEQPPTLNIGSHPGSAYLYTPNYIDFISIKMVNNPIMIGVDTYGRKFVTIAQVIDSNDKGEKEIGVLTFFQADPNNEANWISQSPKLPPCGLPDKNPILSVKIIARWVLGLPTIDVLKHAKKYIRKSMLEEKREKIYTKWISTRLATKEDLKPFEHYHKECDKIEMNFGNETTIEEIYAKIEKEETIEEKIMVVIGDNHEEIVLCEKYLSDPKYHMSDDPFDHLIKKLFENNELKKPISTFIFPKDSHYNKKPTFILKFRDTLFKKDEKGLIVIFYREGRGWRIAHGGLHTQHVYGDEFLTPSVENFVEEVDISIGRESFDAAIFGRFGGGELTEEKLKLLALLIRGFPIKAGEDEIVDKFLNSRKELNFNSYRYTSTAEFVELDTCKN